MSDIPPRMSESRVNFWTLLLSVLVIIATISLWAGHMSSIYEPLNNRVTSLEQTRDRDHDVLIDLRADVRYMRVQLDKLLGNDPARGR